MRVLLIQRAGKSHDLRVDRFSCGLDLDDGGIANVHVIRRPSPAQACEAAADFALRQPNNRHGTLAFVRAGCNQGASVRIAERNHAIERRAHIGICLHRLVTLQRRSSSLTFSCAAAYADLAASICASDERSCACLSSSSCCAIRPGTLAAARLQTAHIQSAALRGSAPPAATSLRVRSISDLSRALPPPQRSPAHSIQEPRESPAPLPVCTRSPISTKICFMYPETLACTSTSWYA